MSLSNNQLSLEMVNRVARELIPSGWHANTQYLIHSDEVVMRLQDTDRMHYFDLEPFSPGELYLSLDAFADFLKPRVEKGIAAIKALANAELSKVDGQ